jgi:hypothetical protein
VWWTQYLGGTVKKELLDINNREMAIFGKAYIGLKMIFNKNSDK